MIRRIRPYRVNTGYGRMGYGPRRGAGARAGSRSPSQGRRQGTRSGQIAHDKPGTGVDLSTELAALKGRHEALLPKLPVDIRRLDKQALPVIERLPALPQIAYLTTLEDYSTLSSTETGRLRGLMERLGGLSETDRTRLAEGATRAFDPIQKDAAQLKAARAKPHETFFRLEDELGRLQQPGAKP